MQLVNAGAIRTGRVQFPEFLRRGALEACCDDNLFAGRAGNDKHYRRMRFPPICLQAVFGERRWNATLRGSALLASEGVEKGAESIAAGSWITNDDKSSTIGRNVVENKIGRASCR